MDPFEERMRRRKQAQLRFLLMIPVLLALLIGGAVYVFTYHINRFHLELELKGQEQMVLEYGVPYQDPGASARFYGSHLVPEGVEIPVQRTGSVDETKLGTYQIRYSASHERWHSEMERTVVIRDTMEPRIWLVEKPGKYVLPGEVYREEGFMARDNYDGDLTDRVKKTVLKNKIIYEVEDSSGNRAKAVRNIVYFDPDPPVIYLTFDDGPSPYTERLLEVLDQYDVKATFFVVNTGYSHLIDDIVSHGHAIGAHTYSHNYREIYSSEEAYFEDLERILDVIEDCSGVRTNLIRFPGGSSNTKSRFNKGIMTRLAGELADRGYYYFDWNVDSNDAGGARTAQEVYENVISGVQNQKASIVLQHDIKEYSVDAVERIIIWGLENGYSFRALNEESPTAAHDIQN